MSLIDKFVRMYSGRRKKELGKVLYTDSAINPGICEELNSLNISQGQLKLLQVKIPGSSYVFSVSGCSHEEFVDSLREIARKQGLNFESFERLYIVGDGEYGRYGVFIEIVGEIQGDLVFQVATVNDIPEDFWRVLEKTLKRIDLDISSKLTVKTEEDWKGPDPITYTISGEQLTEKERRAAKALYEALKKEKKDIAWWHDQPI